MTSVWARVWASVTVVANPSQLFQPIGGVLAQDQNFGSSGGAEIALPNVSISDSAGRSRMGRGRYDGIGQMIISHLPNCQRIRSQLDGLEAVVSQVVATQEDRLRGEGVARIVFWEQRGEGGTEFL